MDILGTTTEKAIWSASPTPFTANGAIDAASVERLVEQHRRLGVTGLFLCGTCGEGPFMPNAQRVELVRLVKRLAGKTMHIAVQVSDTSAARVRVNMREAEDAGADSLVIAPPWIVRFANAEFSRRYFFGSLEERVSVPVGIYILKQAPETGLTPEVWREIISDPAVAFAKDSSGDTDYARAFVEVKSKRPGLRLLTGNEFDVLSTVALGYDGCLLGTAVLNARMIRHALTALARGNSADANAWQERSNALLRDLFRPDISAWMSGLKHAMVTRGIFGNAFAHLAYPLTDADRTRIAAALEREKEHI